MPENSMALNQSAVPGLNCMDHYMQRSVAGRCHFEAMWHVFDAHNLTQNAAVWQQCQQAEAGRFLVDLELIQIGGELDAGRR